MNLYGSKRVWQSVWNIYFHTRKFRKNKVTDTDAKNIILTYVYTWHMGSRWYTSDLHIVIIDI